MKDKEIKKLAQQIFTLEKRYASGEDVSKEMESLAATLSLEEMFAVDEYILENLKNLEYNIYIKKIKNIK